jgi:ABC-type phosphate/phosphonate transport system substrate-binding protein
MKWIASLPMYGFAPAALGAFWSAVSQRLHASGVTDIPNALSTPDTPYLNHWLRNDLLVSQTCGYPLATELKHRVAMLGTFRYRAQGCEGIRCSSQLVVHPRNAAKGLGDFRGMTVAFNSTDSQSGYNSLRAMVAPLAVQGRFFGQSIATGSHLASMQAVLEGRADIAAVDAVTLAGLGAQPDRAIKALVIIGQTAHYPGLPVICANTVPPDVRQAILDAIVAVVQDPAMAPVCAALLMTGFEPIALSDYAICLAMRDQATALGVTEL